MTDFTPTEEQLAIIDAAKSRDDNLIVSALAGAAKTSTLVLIAEALPSVQILCLAFNKKIAVEMNERLPSNCKALTLNSLGHRAWSEALGSRLTLEKSKSYKLVKDEIEKLPDASKTKSDAYDNMSTIIRALDHGKSSGWVPDGSPWKKAKRLRDDEGFFSSLEEIPTPTEEEILRNAMMNSIRLSMKGVIDFNDQIYMPTIFSAMFPTYPLTLVDEAQDLSALNHVMLHKMIGNRRIIAVGDACQAIYGFRGAHEDSMAKLQSEFDMYPLLLSVSFRCPISVVEEARWRAPHMQYPEWAKPGEVRHSIEGGWDIDSIPDGSAVICRNNAPIFNFATKLFANGRYPQVLGNDIGRYLIKTLKKLSKNNIDQNEVLRRIDNHEIAKLSKTRNAARVHDECKCLRIFAAQGQTLNEIVAYAEAIVDQRGPIKLMTGHKSKGLEFERVFILDRQLLRLDEDSGQDENLLYVMQTRAMESLTYISNEDFIGEENDD